jgi:Kef-type K+ transport system membrane component KefB
MTESTWLIAALWVGLALIAILISIRVAISVALVELIVGAAAGNLIPWVGSLFGTPAKLEITPWVNFLAGAGAIVLTFLAGAEIDPVVVQMTRTKSWLSERLWPPLSSWCARW